VTPEALNDIKVASYLSTGDDVTVKVAGTLPIPVQERRPFLSVGGRFYPLNERLEGT